MNRGISQEAFADLCNLHRTYISDVELGKRNVNERIIKLIAITFNVSEEWLKNGNGDMFNEKPNQIAELAYATFKELKPEYQEYVLSQIEQLLEIQKNEKPKAD